MCECERCQKADKEIEKVDAARTSAASAGYGRWQPIDTAPKDGTGILLVNFSRIGVGEWGVARKQHDGYRPNAGNPTWLNWDQEKLFPKPTHWMPLPERP